ncbi:unnamed protein product, partial [Allacma fusca]
DAIHKDIRFKALLAERDAKIQTLQLLRSRAPCCLREYYIRAELKSFKSVRMTGMKISVSVQTAQRWLKTVWENLMQKVFSCQSRNFWKLLLRH